MTHKIYIIDVFTKQNFMGNPVAVVFDADDLNDNQMQQIANWTNLSETTFFQKPTSPNADYKLRIFTPMIELPFAGHPTIGSAFAAIKHGLVKSEKTKIIQECKVGLVEINLNNNIEFKLPKPNISKLSDAQINEISKFIGVPIDLDFTPSIVDVGPKWVIAKLNYGDCVLNAKPDFAKMKEFEINNKVTGITLFGLCGDDDAFIEVRSFAPSSNVNEDPVCGSGNGAVCAFMLENSIISNDFEYIARQGRAIGRNGYIKARINEKNEIFIGGDCTLCLIGEIMV